MTDSSSPVTALDTTVAQRQAFGAVYARPAGLEGLVEKYFGGVHKFPAHPEYRGDITDWTANPFDDNNWQFQHHSFRWITPLRCAALEGYTPARDEWLRVCRSWFEANVPASTAASSWAWKNMADGNRAIQLALGSPLVPADATWFVDLLEAHRDWLLDSTNIVHKNHGMHQHAGLLVVGATLRDEHAMRTAIERMEDQFRVTFDEEGSDDEGAINYHQLNIIWWRELWERARLEGFETPAVVEERLQRACIVLAQLALPDGQLPQIGDTVRGSVVKGLSPFTDFVKTRGAEGERPSGNAMVLKRGYIVSRSGWGEDRALHKESHAVIRYGEPIHGHSHQDRGSVHIYAAGTRWLVDGGFHSYQTRHPTRLHLRSRAAHNVVSLRGVPHIDAANVELERHLISEDVHDFTLLDHGYPRAEVRRRIIYLTGPDCWLIWDTATPPDPAAPLFQRWLVEPGVAVRRLDRGYRLLRSGASLTMTWLGPEPQLRFSRAVKGRLDGWIGVRWKTQEPGSMLMAESAPTDVQLATLIAPPGESPLGVVSSRVTKAGTMRVELIRGGRVWHVSVDPAGVGVIER